MCLAKIYRDEEDSDPLLDNIAYIRFDGDQVEVETLFGETQVFPGSLREVDFVQSRIVFKP